MDESSAGLIITSGDPRSNLDNQLIGVDFTYRNSSLAGGKRLEANTWYQQTTTEGIDGKDTAYGLTVAYLSRTGFKGSMAASQIGENYNPAMGFVSRTGVQKFAADAAYTHRFLGQFLESITSGVSAQRVNYVNGGLQSERVVLQGFRMQNQVGDSLELSHNVRRENLLEPFEISDGLFIDTGLYRFSDSQLEIRSSNARDADIEFTLRSGDIYTGTLKGADIEASWRPSKHFVGSVSYEVDFVDLPQGKFQNRVTSANLATTFSNTLSWVNLLQFDNVSNEFGIDSRFHWTPQPGRNVYFVISHNMIRDETLDRFNSTETGLTAKVDYTFRF